MFNYPTRQQWALLAQEKSTVETEISCMQAVEPQGSEDSPVADLDTRRRLAMIAPDWVNANFWLALSWALLVIKVERPAIYYVTPMVAALGIGAWLSQLLRH